MFISAYRGFTSCHKPPVYRRAARRFRNLYSDYVDPKNLLVATASLSQFNPGCLQSSTCYVTRRVFSGRGSIRGDQITDVCILNMTHYFGLYVVCVSELN